MGADHIAGEKRNGRLKTRRWLFAIIGFMVAALVLPTSACQETVIPYRFTFGSASASSTHYQAAVFMANIITRENPDIKISVVESGATHDNLTKAQAGKLDGGFAVTWDGMAMAYAGTTLGEYVGHGPWEELRMMPGYVHNYVYVVVVDEVDDDGVRIETLNDLDGRRFSAGIAGSVTEFNIRRQLEAVGVEPDWVSASQADIVNMAKELEIVGFARAVTRIGLDSSMLDVQSVRDIRILGWPEEYLGAALLATPGTSAAWIAEDAIEGLIPHNGFYTLGHTTGIFVTTDIPQSVVYRMVKAYVDSWDEYARAWPTAADWVPLETDLELLTEITKLVEMPPLHAGVVQLMIERGYDVPAGLIGPEYQGDDVPGNNDE